MHSNILKNSSCIGDHWKDASNIPMESQYGFHLRDSKGNIISDSVFKLSYVSASLFATIAEDCIAAMLIINECNNSLCVMKAQMDMEKLLAIKYSIPPPANYDPLGKYDPLDLDRDEYKLEKVTLDRNFIYQTLNSLYADLALWRHFDYLKGIVNQIVESDSYFITLQQDEERNRITRRDLYKQVRQMRIHVKSVTYDTDMTIEHLNTQIEDETLNTEIKSRYTESWERARAEQNQCAIEDEEAGPTHRIVDHKQRIDHEQRVHTEFEVLNNIIINETLGKVEELMNKYDKNIEEIDLNIQIKRTEYENTYQRRLDLEKTIKDHDELLNKWVQYKEKREKDRKYRQTMNESAMSVQAWWRGLLVRFKLGPYKETQKKPPPKRTKK